MNETPRIKFTRITGDARTTLAAQFRTAYESGGSVRAIAREAGRSYGFVYRVLSESGVTFRTRAGRRRPTRGGRGGAGPAGGAPLGVVGAEPGGKDASAVGLIRRAGPEASKELRTRPLAQASGQPPASS
ncbi:hypothetical protein SAMN05216371_7516 [Streptomyces sp. TLI_053]|nr:hypothetical protein SAMN05216371_7516 [Streptomyces sp. TLI_053]